MDRSRRELSDLCQLGDLRQLGDMIEAPADGIHPLVQLIRRFVLDWLDRAHAPTCEQIMVPDYTATVGGVTLAGRDEVYLPATLGQLRRFPGLLVTVHDLFTSGQAVALRFSEHGWSAKDNASAAWAGIAIFGWDGTRLTWNVTEEDYLSRRRQLAVGSADPVATPSTAPWSATPEPADPAAEQAVRAWLASGTVFESGGVSLDDGWTGRPTPRLVDAEDIDIDTLFSGGRRVAFHATLRGHYVGGIDLAVEPIGAPVELRMCGMVEVDVQSAIAGHIVRDRVGLRRDLVRISAGAV